MVGSTVGDDDVGMAVGLAVGCVGMAVGMYVGASVDTAVNISNGLKGYTNKPVALTSSELGNPHTAPIPFSLNTLIVYCTCLEKVTLYSGIMCNSAVLYGSNPSSLML